MKKLICLCLAASIFASSCVSAVMAANGNESDIEAAVETAEPIVTSTPDAGGNGTDVGNSVGSETAVGTADVGGVTDMGDNGENTPVNEQAAQNTGIGYDNPILTPEEEERARAYEERLLREMEDEEVAGKVTLASVNMPSYEQYLADWVYSDGEGHGYNLYTKSFSTPYRSYVENSMLSAGTMEIGGNFEQGGNTRYNFYTGGTHKVIFNGSGEQSIYFRNPSNSGFTNVEFKNPNINFTSGIKGFTLQNDINLMNDTPNIIT